ncbi:NusA-like transcription termination signal-binding factor [Candidatus Micrarchaeota archaeon]|nr:NusA-like transcription termination signal-binding factor [Candidatus Micrarchaeota archaeon]
MPKLSNEEIQMINLLELNTGARANDVVLTDGAVVFIVQEGDLGKAIGKKGSNILRLKKILDRGVEVVEDSSNLKQFLKNIFYPVEIKEITTNEADDVKSITLQVDPENKGLAIGRGGEKIERARILVKRHFGYGKLRIL